MSPEQRQPLRRARRHAWRGEDRGRRASHPVKTTYGRKQRAADWDAAARRAAAEWDACLARAAEIRATGGVT